MSSQLQERDQEKWRPVFRSDRAPTGASLYGERPTKDSKAAKTSVVATFTLKPL
jgi:hypothetical protein